MSHPATMGKARFHAMETCFHTMENGFGGPQNTFPYNGNMFLSRVLPPVVRQTTSPLAEGGFQAFSILSLTAITRPIPTP